MWNAVSIPDGEDSHVCVRCLLDSGSHLILVSPDITRHLKLNHRKLTMPEHISLAVNGETKDCTLPKYVTFHLSDPSLQYTSRTVVTIVAPYLSVPILLGLPFMSHNSIIVDAENCTVIHKHSGFDLLNPTAKPDTSKL